MRAFVLLAIFLGACTLTSNQAHVQPNYPEPVPLGASRDAGVG